MRILALFLVLLAAGCAQLQQPATTTTTTTTTAPAKPVAPQITEDTLRDRATSQLAAGVRQYDAGEYDAAQKSLAGSLDHGMLSKPDQARVRKLLAFIHCGSAREGPCRDEFRKAFEIYPDFALTSAEDGHPVWGPIYRSVRTQLIAEREAATTRSRPSFLPLSKGEQLLQEGIVKYDGGDYTTALRLLENALKENLNKADQVRAMKHVAFSNCLLERFPACRAAFVKIYDVDPAFDLAPAEAGHPSWTRTFAGAKAQAKKAIADKAAKEKSPAAPPAAAVPKKN